MNKEEAVEIQMTKQVPVQAKTLKIFLKVRDEFSCRVFDQVGGLLKEYEGYVPNFMPGVHYGDYVNLEIDIATGQILNWKATAKMVEEFVNANNEN